MALKEFKQGVVFCNEGQPMQHLLFITKGSVKASADGKTFRFEKGDMIGICDLFAGFYSHTYTAITDVNVFIYPYSDVRCLDTLLRSSADTANLLIQSMCRQLSSFIQYKLTLKQEADTICEAAAEIFTQYEQLCALYAYTSKKLEGITEVARFSGYDPVKEWMYDYYAEINDLNIAVRKSFFTNKLGITMGFLQNSAEDATKTLQTCKTYFKYIKDIIPLFLNSNGIDLFTLIAELHISAINIKGADAAVETLMARLTGLLGNTSGIDSVYYQKRLQKYNENLTSARAKQEITDGPAETGVKLNLANSLHTILEYSGCPAETCNKFMRDVHTYTGFSDRGSSDDEPRRLRKDLTVDFYRIYQQVFLKCLKDSKPPTVIKMFLNFGYVDAALAGPDKADYLYSIADTLKGDPRNGIYTISEWLTAIYTGYREPSRNEFDEDYATTIHQMRMERHIDDLEEARLLQDKEGKLRFEIENVFPSVNKLTYGIISTFCPLFSDSGIQRKLDTSLVTPELIKKSLNEIRLIDFSAFFREATYTNPELGITSEAISVEVLPEVILMPNVGTRGVMWQEIEGRKRTTPARMYMPIFYQSDLKTLMIRLTSEFRWEMCKRVQGPRWNDISDPSLTSEYSDYLQFFKSNRELSQEVKEGIKTELTRARNTYRTVFTSNYSDWMLYESNGTPRLNKLARRLLLTYCPFPIETREKLATNPQYAELISKFNVKYQQRIKQVMRTIQRMEQTGKPVPQEFLDELEYSKR